MQWWEWPAFDTRLAADEAHPRGHIWGPFFRFEHEGYSADELRSGGPLLMAPHAAEALQVRLQPPLECQGISCVFFCFICRDLWLIFRWETADQERLWGFPVMAPYFDMMFGWGIGEQIPSVSSWSLFGHVIGRRTFSHVLNLAGATLWMAHSTW